VRLKYPYVASELLSLEFRSHATAPSCATKSCAKAFLGFSGALDPPPPPPPPHLKVLQFPKRQRLPPLRLLPEGHPPPPPPYNRAQFANRSAQTHTNLTHLPQVVSQFLSKSPVPCINRIRQLNVVGGLIDNINSFAMVELLLRLASPRRPQRLCSRYINPPLALFLPFNSKHDVPPPPADELQWLAESDFVRRLVLLLHSPDADSQSHAHVALTGLIRSSQLRSPSVITRAGNPAFLIIHYRFSVHNMFVPPQSSIAQPWRTCSSASKPTASRSILRQPRRACRAHQQVRPPAYTSTFICPRLGCSPIASTLNSACSSHAALRCVAETTNEDSNDQCADVVSVIVSVIVGQLDALIAFVRSDLPANTLSSVTTTIRTAQVPLVNSLRKPQTTNNNTATFGHGPPPRCRGFGSHATTAE